MFKSPFSFDGRIRRTEFGITFIILTAFILFLASEYKNDDGTVLMAALPLLWLIGAQGAKRCHDIGKTGWWQCIPFYFLILLTKDGIAGDTKYGEDPKERTAVIADEVITNPVIAKAPASADVDDNPTIIP
ncbi:MAG: DUF805 domain-containing protein [Bacteroidota bacterium]